MDFPADLKYTKDHEWAKVDGKRVKVGITAFAVEQLGDITLVTIDAKVGDQLVAGKTFGTIESVKTLSDLYAPISGKVVEVNGALDASPESVNADPYAAWMIVIETDTPIDGLMDQSAYQTHVKDSAH
ncbi:MAG: glycine cleavage system protein GcvH [Labilithrix sp.]|nr:glycine cleavage system protein GcvH [Labilithrix sp.]MCW5813079.1 glycine cleavage system protein GcvH [Labilithrix sp.]